MKTIKYENVFKNKIKIKDVRTVSILLGFFIVAVIIMNANEANIEKSVLVFGQSIKEITIFVVYS